MKKTILLSILIASIVMLFIYKNEHSPKKIDHQPIKHTLESISDKIESDVLNRLEQNFRKAGFQDFPSEILFVGLKEEQLLQVYAKKDAEIKFIKQYPFTANSGQLGPKLKEGDRQIPEGIYKIEYLNPNSSYYLSLKVSYPNEFDKSKTNFSNIKEMGGDIFIHGKAVTIGCIPIGDEAIEEVFMMAKKAIHKPIKVIISPRDFRKVKAYPSIPHINWEEELYDKIKEELKEIPLL